jgi:hypothetical protein
MSFQSFTGATRDEPVCGFPGVVSIHDKPEKPKYKRSRSTDPIKTLFLYKVIEVVAKPILFPTAKANTKSAPSRLPGLVQSIHKQQKTALENTRNAQAITTDWVCHVCTEANLIVVLNEGEGLKHPLGVVRCIDCRHVICEDFLTWDKLPRHGTSGSDMFTRGYVERASLPFVSVCAEYGPSHRAIGTQDQGCTRAEGDDRRLLGLW